MSERLMKAAANSARWDSCRAAAQKAIEHLKKSDSGFNTVASDNYWNALEFSVYRSIADLAKLEAPK